MSDDDFEEGPRRPVSPVMIVVALGVIASMLYPFIQIFLTTERSRHLAAQGFGFVVVTMAGLALFHLARLWLSPPKE